jgi:NNP family nitrate/nitrite transporter-like MFS transporter
MIPIVLLSAWVFRPEIAKVANTAGFTGVAGEDGTATADD